jgi:hypothetical protein
MIYGREGPAPAGSVPRERDPPGMEIFVCKYFFIVEYSKNKNIALHYGKQLSFGLSMNR